MVSRFQLVRRRNPERGCAVSQIRKTGSPHKLQAGGTSLIGCAGRIDLPSLDTAPPDMTHSPNAGRLYHLPEEYVKPSAAAVVGPSRF